MQEVWKDYKRVDEKIMKQDFETNFSKQILLEVAKSVTEIPKDSGFLKKVYRLFENRKKMFFDDEKVEYFKREIKITYIEYF